jgi:putative salt-induced outer membrane protein YdiY
MASGLGVLVGVAAAADEVVLKDGNRIIGEVVDLVEGTLTFKVGFAADLKIKWSEVKSLRTDKPLPFHLEKGSKLQGKTIINDDGSTSIQLEERQTSEALNLEQVVSINPPFKPEVTYKGFVQAGGTITDGNTQTRSGAINGEFEARTQRQRFTLGGAYNYAEDEDAVTARNARGFIKYDFFVTKRFYLFSSAFFEGDSFQDLNLRTALSAGPGYQFIDIGDFEAVCLSKMQLSAEAGLSYFNEDFDGDDDDQSYVAARWSVKWDWPVMPDKIIIFHLHEGFPGLENGDDLYIRSEQGVRFIIVKNFFAAFQVNWRWDNTPADDNERSDTTYLASLGYNFSF